VGGASSVCASAVLLGSDSVTALRSARWMRTDDRDRVTVRTGRRQPIPVA